MQQDIEGGEKKGVLYIPYDPKLYISNFDAQLIKDTKLSKKEMRNKIRMRLNTELHLNAKKTMRTLSVFNLPDSLLLNDLDYIYNSTGYQYKYVPAEKDSSKEKKGLAKVIDKIKRNKKEKERGKIKEGQIVSKPVYGERYMDTKLINDNLIDWLSKKYGTKKFVFINQFDIKKSPDATPQNLQMGRYNMRIKVHYTIFNHNEEKIYGSAVYAEFPSYQTNLNKIMNKYFPRLAKEINRHLSMEQQLSKAEKQKKKKQKKQAKERREEIELNFED
ncbi:MAG: hypothetical protein ABEH43_00405 [Flavobacteriales bacterium]